MGTLTPQWRECFFGIYRGVFGWSEIDNGAKPGRLTMATGGSCYLNIRERDVPMSCSGYEHFGMVVDSADRVEAVWLLLAHMRDRFHGVRIDLDDVVRNADGSRAFRFMYLLPMAMEVQYLPPGAADVSPRPWGRSKAL